MSGGGGTAGKVGFPRYLERQQEQFLLGGADDDNDISPTTTVYDLWETALGAGGNPFSGLSYTDPSTDLGEVDTEVGNFKSDVSGLDISSELNNAVVAAVDASDGTAIARALKNMQDRQKHTKARSLRAFSGQMAGINAVNSSAYMFGVALIEGMALQNIENAHADMTIRQQEQLTQAYLNMRVQKTQLLQAVATTMLEFKRIKIVAEAEYIGNDADLSHRHATWDWEVTNHTIAFMGGLGGGTALPKGPSKAASAIGGALSGAAAGAAAGSVIPGVGTAIGAGIGGVLGGSAGLLQ